MAVPPVQGSQCLTCLHCQDSSGVIENEELGGFLKDLLELVQEVLSLPDSCCDPTGQDYDSSDLADFAKTIMKGCDTNRDGKISKKVLDGAYGDCEDD